MIKNGSLGTQLMRKSDKQSTRSACSSAWTRLYASCVLPEMLAHYCEEYLSNDQGLLKNMAIYMLREVNKTYNYTNPKIDNSEKVND